MSTLATLTAELTVRVSQLLYFSREDEEEQLDASIILLTKYFLLVKYNVTQENKGFKSAHDHETNILCLLSSCRSRHILWGLRPRQPLRS